MELVTGLMRKTKCLLIIFAMVPMVFSGCVSTQTAQKTTKMVFFPEAPSLPRYQFLKSFNGSEDFKEKASGLSMFIGVANNTGFVIKKPYGVAMVDGSIYVADTMNTVFKLDLVNQKFSPLQGAKGLGKLVMPINIAVDGKGNKYVCDPTRSQVIKYDNNDFYVKSYASPDEWKPVAAAVFEGLLYVVDSTKNKGQVYVFDVKTGQIVDRIGQRGNPDSLLRIPTNIALDQQGYLYVMDSGRFQVVKFDRDGHYIGYLGGAGSSYGFFGRPRGVAVDRDGRVYTADAAFDHIQVFTSNGQVLTAFGDLEDGTPGAMTMPAGVWIDYDNVQLFQQYAALGFEIEYLLIVANQFNPNAAINVYGYGKLSGKKYESDEILLDAKKEEDLRKKK